MYLKVLFFFVVLLSSCGSNINPTHNECESRPFDGDVVLKMSNYRIKINVLGNELPVVNLERKLRKLASIKRDSSLSVSVNLHENNVITSRGLSDAVPVGAGGDIVRIIVYTGFDGHKVIVPNFRIMLDPDKNILDIVKLSSNDFLLEYCEFIIKSEMIFGRDDSLTILYNDILSLLK